jgi:sulfite exporter TauE/SafE
MFTPLTLFTYALILGLFHSFEGDHIAAVSAMSLESKNTSIFGFFWGVGHTLTLLIAGGFALLLGTTIPENFSNFFEGFAGILLLVLGISVIYKVQKNKLHIHSHKHGRESHIHIHSHKKTLFHKHEHKSFIFGVFHGLAGSGTLLLIILPATTSLSEGILFILVFGLGSIFGMTMASFLLGKALRKIKNFLKIIQYSAGAFSVFMGATIVVSVFA